MAHIRVGRQRPNRQRLGCLGTLRDLAKVDVAGSSPLARSKRKFFKMSRLQAARFLLVPEDSFHRKLPGALPAFAIT